MSDAYTLIKNFLNTSSFVKNPNYKCAYKSMTFKRPCSPKVSNSIYCNKISFQKGNSILINKFRFASYGSTPEFAYEFFENNFLKLKNIDINQNEEFIKIILNCCNQYELYKNIDINVDFSFIEKDSSFVLKQSSTKYKKIIIDSGAHVVFNYEEFKSKNNENEIKIDLGVLNINGLIEPVLIYDWPFMKNSSRRFIIPFEEKDYFFEHKTGELVKVSKESAKEYIEEILLSVIFYKCKKWFKSDMENKRNFKNLSYEDKVGYLHQRKMLSY